MRLTTVKGIILAPYGNCVGTDMLKSGAVLDSRFIYPEVLIQNRVRTEA